jgi:CubicO group peptidase (beta-lactamase class C family)
MNFQNIKNFMDRLTAELVPGNVLCMYVRGQEVFRYASGYADMENRIPMTGSELLNIYSCSKVATAVAAAQLVEQGRILLNDPLCDYLPEYRHMQVKQPDGTLAPAKRLIRIGDLFGMSAGMNYDLNSPAHKKARAQTNGTMDTVTVARCMAENPLSYEPGMGWDYSLAHDVLAAVVSVVSGMKFRDYVQQYIFAPLDIRDAHFHRTPEIEARMAQQYRLRPRNAPELDSVSAQKGRPTREGVIVNVGKSVGSFVPGPEYDSGGAGIVVSVPEYAKLAAALANGGLGANGQRILSPATVALMHTDRLNARTRPGFNWEHLQGYGYGLGVRTLIDPAAAGALSPVGEFGWGGAAGATLLADTRYGVGVFYAHHMLNPLEWYYQPRLRNVVYGALE